MNFIDIIILILVSFYAWKGFRKGLIIEVFTLLALLLGIYAAIHFSDWTAIKMLGDTGINDSYIPVIAFTITFLAVGAMVFFLGKVIEKMLSIAQLSLPNKLLGLLLGIIKVIYVLSIVIILIETYDERGHFIETEIKEESRFYYPVQKVSQKTIPAISESTIWLKNNANLEFLDSLNFPFDDVEEIRSMKKSADSLGISLDHIQNLKQKADSLGITIEDVQEFLRQNGE